MYESNTSAPLSFSAKEETHCISMFYGDFGLWPKPCEVAGCLRWGFGENDPANGAQAGGESLRSVKITRRNQITPRSNGEVTMLWTIFVILLILWLLGMVSSYTLGGFIHILLLVALVVLLIRVISGRRVTI